MEARKDGQPVRTLESKGYSHRCAAAGQNEVACARILICVITFAKPLDSLERISENIQMGLTYSFSFVAPAAVPAEQLMKFLETVEGDARLWAFHPTMVVNGPFDTPGTSSVCTPDHTRLVH